jgi:hypothetical protein
MTELPDLPVTCPVSRTTILRLVVFSIGFVLLGLWLRPQVKMHLPGTAFVIFGGLGLLAALAKIHPRACYITLTADGLRFAVMFRPKFVAWKDVESFKPIVLGSNHWVGVNFKDSYPAWGNMRKFRFTRIETDGVLPDTWGMSADELANTLNGLLAKYAR